MARSIIDSRVPPFHTITNRRPSGVNSRASTKPLPGALTRRGGDGCRGSETSHRYAAAPPMSPAIRWRVGLHCTADTVRVAYCGLPMSGVVVLEVAGNTASADAADAVVGARLGFQTG